MTATTGSTWLGCKGIENRTVLDAEGEALPRGFGCVNPDISQEGEDMAVEVVSLTFVMLLMIGWLWAPIKKLVYTTQP
jgi:hypothetical protein